MCGYADCQQEITGQDYIFKYFSEDKLHKPVHSYHLNSKRKGKKIEVQTTDYRGNRTPRIPKTKRL